MACCEMNGSSRGRWVVLALVGIGIASIAIEFKWGSRAAAKPSVDAVEQVPAAAPNAHVAAKTPEEAGRYLVMTGGCNDCHTPGFMQAGTKVPELEWLTGVPLGWYGPWGTTYASNLRLLVADMPEAVWLKMMHERHDRPPMPWSSLNSMSEQDGKALYTYIKSLGKRGEKTPEPLAPGVEPKTPFLVMVPQAPKDK